LTTVNVNRVALGNTVTVTDADAVCPIASVTVTVYVVVAAGLARGAALLASSNPALGDHEKLYGRAPSVGLA
jgi:hypothetical protein